MSNETLVLKLPVGEQEALEARLAAGGFDWRSVPHARFSVKGEGVVATQYRSGKLVVQGAGTEAFALRYLEGAAAAPAKAKPERKPLAAADDVVCVGSDEAGKGDLFGPLVVCAVRLEPGERAELAASGVADSKTLSDGRMAKLAPALMGRYAHAIERLDPPEYNAAHAEVGNLNLMLADLHARAVRRLVEGAGGGEIDVLIDRFAKKALLEERLAGLPIHLRQEVRAERDTTVAAASVIARHVFVESLRELSEDCAVDLRKGAGPPTDRAAREYVALHGLDALGRVAKLHFKNAKRLGA